MICKSTLARAARPNACRSRCLTSCSASGTSRQPQVKFRTGCADDLPAMRAAVWKERMNPLSLVPERFCIAELSTDPHDESNEALAQTSTILSNTETTGNHSRTFSKDSGGALSKAVFTGKTSDTSGPGNAIVALGQMQLQETGIWELRSLVVDSKYRGQGIGSGLVRQLLHRVSPGEAVFLTTLKSRIIFYERLGFKLVPVPQIPRFLWFEALAGTAVARLVAGKELVVMKK